MIPSTLRKLIPAVLMAATACADPSAPEAVRAPALAATYGSTLLECPTDVTKSASGRILPLVGGTVEVDGTSISIPGSAILVPTDITVTVPASNYMEVDIKANGAEHFTFEAPVTVTIGYGRCSRSNIQKLSLSAWYIDSSNKTLLEFMGGTDDKTARKVSFQTGHLSGYAIAY